MKHIFIYIIILSIVFFQFTEVVIFVSFKINQEYIAKNLCVEKDVEDSSCKGCCQLKKQISQHQKQKKELPPSQKDKQNIPLFLNRPGNETEHQKLIKLMQVVCTNNYSFLGDLTIFHPPRIKS